MYTVTNDYETYVKAEARNYSLSGTIVNTNSVTMTVTRDNILEDSFSFSKQCVNNNSFGIGSCAIGSMEITLQGDYHHSLYNAEITLQQGIWVTGDSYHMQKIGTWIIKKAVWNGEWVTLTCYDKMYLTQKKYSLSGGTYTPYALFSEACTALGITLATTQAEIEAMTNGTQTFTFNGSTQETDRKWSDVLSDMCAAICGFCTINRFGNMEVHQFGRCYKRIGTEKTYYTAAVDTLTKNDRITGGAFGNGAINITGIYINDRASKNADKSILVGNTTGTTLNLGYNRWLSSTTSGYATMLQNILTQLTACQFYAADVHLADVSLYDLGDLITLQAGGELSLSEDILMCVMNIDYNFADESTISSYTFSEASDSSTSAVETNLTNRIETLESSQGDGGNKIYTSTRIPTSSDTANEGDLWYQMNYKTSGAFDFPDWGYTLPLEYNPGNFRLADVRSSLELRFYDTANDIYLYYLFLGGTNYSIVYNRLGPTNTFDGFDKDTGDLQVTTENEQGTAWTYWNYIPRWNDRNYNYLIANPLGQGYSDHNMSPNVGTITYNIYSILGYASKISSGEYRLDGFRLITDGFETSWQYGKANDYNVITRWVYKENNWQVADYIAGDGVTIKNGIISANGSEIVQVNPIVTSGTQLATINGTSIYAPTVSASQTLSSGTEIGNITVGSTSTTLYAPTPQSVSATQTLSSGTEIGSITIDNNTTTLYAPTGGGSDVTVTPKTSTGTNIADIEVDGTTYQLFAPSSGGGGEAIETAFIYSNEERVVGVWTDNKPLYQKTLNLTSPSGVFEAAVIADLTSLNIENLVKVEGFLYSATYSQTLPIYWSYAINNSDIRNSNWGTVYYENHSLKQNISSPAYTQCPVTITIQYTKTTDTPGSAPYVTSGAYAHHYSTTEQVVGTWIDSSTIYERTYDLGSDLTLQDSTWTDIGISVPTNANRCIKAEGIQSDGTSTCIMASVTSTNITVQSTKNSGDSIRYLTIQYTKTS